MAFGRLGTVGAGFGHVGALPGGGSGVSAAAGGAALLTGETDGFATDFTYATDAQRVAKKVASVTTEYATDAFYSNAGTSPKMVYDVAGNLVWSPHNLFLNSAAPVSQSVTVANAVNYTVSVVGSGSLTLSGGGSGVATAGAPLTFTTVSTSVTFTKAGTLTQIQLNRGPVATAYLATTASQRFGLAVDYDPVTHAGKGLLVEPAGTNLISWSNRLDVWTMGGITRALDATGPMGANTAWTLTCNAGATGKWIYTDRIGGTAPFRHSVYAKAGTLSWISMGDASASPAHAAYFNLTAGTVGTVAGRFSAASMEAVGNGWYRCSATVATGSAFFDVQPHSADNQAYTWTAVGGETVFVSAAQAEAGTVATSYIPTGSASATRAADLYTFPLSAIPWSDAVATVYVDYTLHGVGAGVTAYIWEVYKAATVRFEHYIDAFNPTMSNVNTAQDVAVDLGTSVNTTRTQVTIGVQANNFAGSQNGAAIISDTTAALNTGYVTFCLGNNGGTTAVVNAHLLRIAHVNRRVADASLPTWRYTP